MIRDGHGLTLATKRMGFWADMARMFHKEPLFYVVQTLLISNLMPAQIHVKGGNPLCSTCQQEPRRPKARTCLSCHREYMKRWRAEERERIQRLRQRLADLGQSLEPT